MYKSILIFIFLIGFVFAFSGLTGGAALSGKTGDCCTMEFAIVDTNGNPVTHCTVSVPISGGGVLTCNTGSGNTCRICMPQVSGIYVASAGCAFNLHGSTTFVSCSQDVVTIVVEYR